MKGNCVTRTPDRTDVQHEWPQAILFDLDGTLIDSALDITAAVNELLSADGRPAQTVDAVRGMIGNGVRKLVERAYEASGRPVEGKGLDQAYERMMGIYGKHLTRHTVLLPDAMEMVMAYREAGVKVGVVTNKPEGFTREILAHFMLDQLVAVVVGGDTGPARKPAPDMLEHALHTVGVTAAGALMVGDSPADIGAAKAARMASVAVRGGYTTVPADDLGADRVISNLMELPAAIEALREPV